MSHICQSTVLIKNFTEQKGLDTIFSFFIMSKTNLCMENKSWVLLSSMTTISLYSGNKLLMPLSLIHKNYLEVITNNGPGSNITEDVKESSGYQVMLQSMLALKKHLVHLMKAAWCK